MKKLSFVLLVTLLLCLCSCAPAPNGEQIFDIKEPKQIILYDNFLASTSYYQADHATVQLTSPADVTAICDLLNGLTLTEIDSDDGIPGEFTIRIEGEHALRNITVSGVTIHCDWTDKTYQADKDITEDLTAYLTREVGTVSSGKDLFQTDKITRITVTNSQWEEVEMTDITPAVEALSGLTLTRANMPWLEGGLKARVYLQDGSSISITFGGDLIQVNNKMYQVDRNISDLFRAVIHS